jgi:hypothetical protein
MRSATLARILRQIRNQLEDEDYTPVTILGKSGIGKTESIRALSEELSIGFRELRLSHYQESDLIGLPYISGDGFTMHAPADLLPDTKDKNQGILLLDEITAAPKSMRCAVYQLLDSARGLGRYKLPNRWLVVACGNGPDDGGDFRGIEPAFLSRGFCWRAEENLTVWKTWALRSNIHPVVIAYLDMRPESLHIMDPDRQYDMIACPRNWAKLSVQLKNMEARNGVRSLDHGEEVLFSADGCVGAKCGAAFAAFYENMLELVDPQRILNGDFPASKLLDSRDEVLYITVQNFVRYVADIFLAHTHGNGAHASDKGHAADSAQFLHILASACEWIADVGKTVRLDMAIVAFQDIATALGPNLTSLMLTEKFAQMCPDFSVFAAENAIILL